MKMQLNKASSRDLRLIRKELLTERQVRGHSFICNMHDIEQSFFEGRLYMLHHDHMFCGFIVIIALEDFSPEILNIWHTMRREGLGRAAVQLLAAKMRGRTMRIEVSGAVGADRFWTSMGFPSVQPEPWEGDIRTKEVPV